MGNLNNDYLNRLGQTHLSNVEHSVNKNQNETEVKTSDIANKRFSTETESTSGSSLENSFKLIEGSESIDVERIAERNIQRLSKEAKNEPNDSWNCPRMLQESLHLLCASDEICSNQEQEIKDESLRFNQKLKNLLKLAEKYISWTEQEVSLSTSAQRIDSLIEFLKQPEKLRKKADANEFVKKLGQDDLFREIVSDSEIKTLLNRLSSDWKSRIKSLIHFPKNNALIQKLNNNKLLSETDRKRLITHHFNLASVQPEEGQKDSGITSRLGNRIADIAEDPKKQEFLQSVPHIDLIEMQDSIESLKEKTASLSDEYDDTLFANYLADELEDICEGAINDQLFSSQIDSSTEKLKPEWDCPAFFQHSFEKLRSDIDNTIKKGGEKNFDEYFDNTINLFSKYCSWVKEEVEVTDKAVLIDKIIASLTNNSKANKDLATSLKQTDMADVLPKHKQFLINLFEGMIQDPQKQQIENIIEQLNNYKKFPQGDRENLIKLQKQVSKGGVDKHVQYNWADTQQKKTAEDNPLDPNTNMLKDKLYQCTDHILNHIQEADMSMDKLNELESKVKVLYRVFDKINDKKATVMDAQFGIANINVLLSAIEKKRKSL